MLATAASIIQTEMNEHLRDNPNLPLRPCGQGPTHALQQTAASSLSNPFGLQSAASATVSSLSLEQYVSLYNALTKGSETVQKVRVLESA